MAAELRHVVGEVYFFLGENVEALKHVSVAFDLRRQLRGPAHRAMLRSAMRLATIHDWSGRFSEAEALLVETLDLQKANLPNDDPDTLKSMVNLCANYGHQGRLDKFKLLVLQTLEIQTRLYGETHENTVHSKGNLANVYSMEGQLDEAITQNREMLEIATRLHGADHPNTLESAANLANQYCKTDELKKAIEILEGLIDRSTNRYDSPVNSHVNPGKHLDRRLLRIRVERAEDRLIWPYKRISVTAQATLQPLKSVSLANEQN